MHVACALFRVPLALVVIALAAGSAGAAPEPASLPSALGLKLNEIMPGPARDWDGSGAFSSRDDEWVEVENTSMSPIDLSAYFVTDRDSVPRFAFSGSLDPQGRRIVYGKDAYDWEKATGHPAFGLSLGNSGDAVLLWHVSGAETTLVDVYEYRSHEAAADRAIGRIPDGTGGWALFDGLNPYTGTAEPQGTGCPPTPGAANECQQTPVRSASWGKVKTLYR